MRWQFHKSLNSFSNVYVVHDADFGTLNRVWLQIQSGKLLTSNRKFKLTPIFFSIEGIVMDTIALKVAISGVLI